MGLSAEAVEALGAPAFVPAGATVPLAREALARHLARHGLDYDPSEPLRQFAGGLANRNYLVTVNGCPAVLRRPPDGDLPPGAHDMAREHLILSRLAGVLPFVPPSLLFCPDPDVIGVPFQLIAYRAGLVIRGGTLPPGLPADAPARLSATLVETLARLHAVDPASVGLGAFGRPDGFVARAVASWTRRGRAFADDPVVAGRVEEVADWLGRRSIAERAPTLLHCDLKLDNLILDPGTLEPVAVVDWDMGTRGDPLFDLATTLSYWAEPGDPEALRDLDQMPTARPGFWSRDEAAGRYAERTGRPLDDLPTLRVLGMFKLGIVFLQLHRQWASGAVADPRYGRFDRLGRDLLGVAADLAHHPDQVHA